MWLCILLLLTYLFHSINWNVKLLNFQSKDGSVDSTFPVIKDQTQFSVAHARSSKVVEQNNVSINKCIFYNALSCQNLFLKNILLPCFVITGIKFVSGSNINLQKPEKCVWAMCSPVTSNAKLRRTELLFHFVDLLDLDNIAIFSNNGIFNDDFNPPCHSDPCLLKFYVSCWLFSSLGINNTTPSTVPVITCIQWSFLYVYLFTLFTFWQSNPIARWHICQGSINNVAFSTDGVYLATVGRDGILSSTDSRNLIKNFQILDPNYWSWL